MLQHLSDYCTEIKLTLAAIIGMSAWLADASAAMDLKGWDEIGLKGILLFAVYYIGRLFLQAQKEHKAEMIATWETHKADSARREDRMVTALDQTGTRLERIAELGEEQLTHFRSFVKAAIDDKLKPH